MKEKKSLDEREKELIDYIQEEYPEAFIYYALGKLFRWQPSEIDELDFNFCLTLLKIEELNLEKERLELESDSEEKTSKFPDEWKDMPVADIIKTDKFKEAQVRDSELARMLFKEHGTVTALARPKPKRSRRK